MLMEPRINGYETYSKIVQLYPKQRAVLVSGFSKSDAVTDALQLGASTFVHKPYTLLSISKAVRDALSFEGKP